MSNNPVQDALEKLRRARKARADFDKKIKDGVAMFERNVSLLCDLVNDQMPLKSRDEQILLSDEEYAEYARKHFGLQLSVLLVLAQEASRKQTDAEESDFKDDLPKDLEY